MSDDEVELNFFLEMPFEKKAEVMFEMAQESLKYMLGDDVAFNLATDAVKKIKQYVHGEIFSPDELARPLNHPEELKDLGIQLILLKDDSVRQNALNLICSALCHIAHHEFLKVGRYKDMPHPVNESTDDLYPDMFNDFLTLTGNYPEIN